MSAIERRLSAINDQADACLRRPRDVDEVSFEPSVQVLEAVADPAGVVDGVSRGRRSEECQQEGKREGRACSPTSGRGPRGPA